MDWMDSRFVCTGPVLHFASAHDAHLTVANLAESNATRSYSGQNDVDHATRFKRDVLLLTIWIGFVLVDQQYIVDHTTMVDQ